MTSSRQNIGNSIHSLNIFMDILGIDLVKNNRSNDHSKYYIKNYFHHMNSLPFINCKRVHPVLNSQRQSCLKRDNMRDWNSPNPELAR